MVKSRTGSGEFCFAVNGNKGYLALELDQAFGMWTEGHPVQAKVTSDGKETVINAPKNDYKPSVRPETPVSPPCWSSCASPADRLSTSFDRS